MLLTNVFVVHLEAVSAIFSTYTYVRFRDGIEWILYNVFMLAVCMLVYQSSVDFYTTKNALSSK